MQALDLHRRRLLKHAGMLAALLGPGVAALQPAHADGADRAFASTSMDELLAAMGGTPLATSDVTLDIADIAENGALVPVAITSRLPDTHEISIVVATNPFPLVARFDIPTGTDPFVSTRVKLAASGPVCAVVRAGDRLYVASKDTAVIVGGCGG